MSTRWHPKNGLLMCTGPTTKNCHYWFDNVATPAVRREFVVKQIGEETVVELEQSASVMWDKDFAKAKAGLK